MFRFVEGIYLAFLDELKYLFAVTAVHSSRLEGEVWSYETFYLFEKLQIIIRRLFILRKYNLTISTITW